MSARLAEIPSNAPVEPDVFCTARDVLKELLEPCLVEICHHAPHQMVILTHGTHGPQPERED